MEFLFVWLFLAMLVLAAVSGSVIERRHLQRLDASEREFGSIVLTSARRLPLDHRAAATSELCVGSVVMSVDYFRSFLARLKLLVGGRVGSLDAVIRRARREAMCRMLEEARRCGAELVLNVRIETAELGGAANNATIAAEVVAYGTAVRYR